MLTDLFLETGLLFIARESLQNLLVQVKQKAIEYLKNRITSTLRTLIEIKMFSHLVRTRMKQKVAFRGISAQFV